MVTGFLKGFLIWVISALTLHGLWEVLHLPLYTLWDDPNRGRVVRYLAHCLAGDVLIAVGTYLLTAIVFRELDWPRRRPWPAGAVAVALGLGFTVWSEWYNVYILGAWAYAPTMPTVAGIGLTPLLQWLIVPVLTILLIRRLLRNSPARRR